MDRTIKIAALIFAIVAVASVVGCQPNSGAGSPAPVGLPTSVVPPAGKVTWNGDYSTNIQPIFDTYCVQCHGPQRAENGLRLDSYQEVMKGTSNGPVVVPGQPSASALVSVLRGTTDPSIRMPHGGQRVSDQALENIVLWIEAGAPPPK